LKKVKHKNNKELADKERELERYYYKNKEQKKKLEDLKEVFNSYVTSDKAVDARNELKEAYRQIVEKKQLHQSLVQRNKEQTQELQRQLNNTDYITQANNLQEEIEKQKKKYKVFVNMKREEEV